MGFVFASLILITGIIWGKADVGWWWTWDAKLTTTLILWFVYLGYLIVRAYTKGSQSARFGAIVAIIGAIDAPIIYMATVWWRTAHPELNIGPLSEEQDALGSTEIYVTLLVSVITFTVVYVYMLFERCSMKGVEV